MKPLMLVELVNYVFMFPWKGWARAARRVGVQVGWWRKISTPSTRIPPAMLATGILNPCWNWQLWDVEAQKKLRSMTGHSARVGCLSWNSFILSRYDSWNLLNLLFQRFERIFECWNILLQFDKKKIMLRYFTSWHYLDTLEREIPLKQYFRLQCRLSVQPVESVYSALGM